MSRLYADCQNLAGWINQQNPNEQIIESLISDINSSTEKNASDTIKIALKRMPRLQQYIPAT